VLTAQLRQMEASGRSWTPWRTGARPTRPRTS